MDPRERDARFKSLLLHIARSPGKKKMSPHKTKSFKIPRKFASVSWSPKWSHMDRDGPLPGSVLYFTHSFVSVRVPRIGALPRNGATTYSHRPRSPTLTEGLQKIRCGLLPRKDRLSLLSPPQCYAAFSTILSNLARLNQSPDSQGAS